MVMGRGLLVLGGLGKLKLFLFEFKMYKISIEWL